MHDQLDEALVKDLVARILHKNGTLENRANGGIRIRWRSSQNSDRQRQLSFDAPPDVADAVRRIAVAQIQFRDLIKEMKKMTHVTQEKLDKEIKALRQKVSQSSPGGRASKKKAVQVFDDVIESRRADLFQVYQKLEIWTIRLGQVGRPLSGNRKRKPPVRSSTATARKQRENVSWQQRAANATKSNENTSSQNVGQEDDCHVSREI